MRRITQVTLRSSELTELEAIAQVRSFKGTELLGTIYDFAIEVVTRDQALDPTRMLAAPLTIDLSVDGGETHRQIHGVAAQVTDHLTTESKTPIYRLRFVPRLWRLTLTQTTEIFMDMTVPEVIAAKLERAGFVQGTDFELRLRASYPAREYIVQYDETDLRFVQRLAEHVGITLFFEQDEDHERVVLADHDEAFGELAEGGVARFFPRGDERGVFELTSTTSTLPARYVVKDYNYRTPQVALLGDARAPDVGTGIVYEYGGHFKTPDEAEQLSRIRAEEAACRRVVFEGRADDVRLAPGARVKLDGHPLGEPELLITRVDHDYKDVTFLHGGTGDEHSYRSRFEAVSSEVPYRPARVTPKPRIHGCITAQIEAAHESPYAELDEEGRYHVRFLFDVGDAPRGKATRLVRMAQPHTGPGYGFHFPLRHGVEVLITFIDGDPDRPIISAAVPNPQTPSVVGSGNRTRNIIRTGAGNEINIDDTEGAERIKLSTPYGDSSFQLGAPNLPGGGAALSTTDAYNAVAQSSITTASTAVSIFSDIASCFASADIIDFAGASNIMSKLLGKAPDLVKKVAQVADGTLDTAAKIEAAQVARARSEAADHRAEADTWRAKKQAYEKASPGLTPSFYDEKIAYYERLAAQKDTEANHLEGQKKLNDDARADVKSVTGIAKTIADAAKVREDVKNAKKAYGDAKDASAGFRGEDGKQHRDTWSKASEVASKATQTAAAGGAAMSAAAGSAFAAVPRIPGSVAPPGSPMNLQAAANGAALIGGATALVAAPNASVVGAAQAVLASGGRALVKSPAAAELTGVGRALMTSAALIDLKSGGAVKVFAAGVIKGTAARLKLNAGSDASLVAGGKVLVQSSAKATVQGVSVDLKASGPMSLNASATADIEAGGSMNVKAGGKYDVNAGGDATLKGPKVKCAGSGASLTVSGVADLKSNGNALIDAGGTATVKGASVNVKSGGAVNLSGSVIKAKGRCLLG